MDKKNQVVESKASRISDHGAPWKDSKVRDNQGQENTLLRETSQRFSILQALHERPLACASARGDNKAYSRG